MLDQMAVDLYLPDLTGDGVEDLSGLPQTFINLVARVTVQGPFVRNPVPGDLENVFHVAYFQFGFLDAAGPGGTTQTYGDVMWDQFRFYVDNLHAYWSTAFTPHIQDGWDKLKYHVEPGCTVTAWLVH